ncbi:hypothetical protein HK102_002593, partial [Quaeritorhiza haematococci]
GDDSNNSSREQNLGACEPLGDTAACNRPTSRHSTSHSPTPSPTHTTLKSSTTSTTTTTTTTMTTAKTTTTTVERTAAPSPTLPAPPVAKKIPATATLLNTPIVDDYTWLRNLKTDPDVVKYIDAENRYTDEMMNGTRGLQDVLIAELGEWEDRLEDDVIDVVQRGAAKRSFVNGDRDGDGFRVTVFSGEVTTTASTSSKCAKLESGVTSFWEYGNYFYWIRYAEDLIHPIYVRKRILPSSQAQSASSQCGCLFWGDSPEEVVLDLNQIVAQNASYLYMGVFEVNPHDESLLAFSIDLKGDEKYTLFFRNITTGDALGPSEGISDTYYSARWSKGNWIYYTVVDPLWGVPRFVYRYCAVGCGQAPQSMSDAANESSGGVNNSIGPNSGDGVSNTRARRQVTVSFKMTDSRMATERPDLVRLPGEQSVYVEDDLTLTTEVSSTNDGSFILIKVIGRAFHGFDDVYRRDANSNRLPRAPPIFQAAGQVTSETLILREETQQTSLFIPLLTRILNVQYDVEYYDGYFFVRTNARDASNFFIVKVPASMVLTDRTKLMDINDIAELAVLDNQNLENGGDRVVSIVPHSATRFIERMELFVNHLVAWVWIGGSRQIMVVPLQTSNDTAEGVSSPSSLSYFVPLAGEEDLSSRVYSVFPSTLTDMESRLYRRFNTTCLDFSNSSFVHPFAYYSHDMVRQETHYLAGQRLRAVDSATTYREERLWASSYSPLNKEGEAVRIPLSVVYKADSSDRNDTSPNGSETANATARVASPRPLLMIAYGAYGGWQEPKFSTDIFPLLERGFVYAICHPRGDRDLGTVWYLDGKYDKKENTFFDVRDCMRHLVEAGYTERGRIAVKARSAGGLVAGYVINNNGWVASAALTTTDASAGNGTEGNQTTSTNATTNTTAVSSDEYAAVVIAEVPFIDPILDMADETVPWTTYEWYEWGNPGVDREILSSMFRYSPYHNIGQKGGDMPSVMVIGGMEDPRVPYWEPTKYAAKLREFKTNLPRRKVGAGGTGSQQSASSSNSNSTATHDAVAGSEGEQAAILERRDVAGTPLLLRITGVGHFASGTGGQKFERLAEWYAFMIEELSVHFRLR